jgi:cysteinyl-tRNA synthetase
MVRYWAHNGLLRAGTDSDKIGGKMSRSQGAGGLADLIKRQSGERIRFFLLRTHYRSTVLFNEPEIEEAGKGLEAFNRLFKRYTRITGKDFYELRAPITRESGNQPPALPGVPSDPALTAAATAREKFLAAMDDDFNTGGAIGELFELAKITNKFADDHDLEAAGKSNADAVVKFTTLLTTIKELANILGLFCQPPALPGVASNDLLAKLMPLVIDLRAAARKNKNFAVADKIRDALGPIGVTLEDRAGQTEWNTTTTSGEVAAATGDASARTDAIMQLLIQLRADSRAAKDFATADTIRNRLTDLGITLEDRAAGTEWSRA